VEDELVADPRGGIPLRGSADGGRPRLPSASAPEAVASAGSPLCALVLPPYEAIGAGEACSARIAPRPSVVARQLGHIQRIGGQLCRATADILRAFRTQDSSPAFLITEASLSLRRRRHRERTGRRFARPRQSGRQISWAAPQREDAPVEALAAGWRMRFRPSSRAMPWMTDKGSWSGAQAPSILSPRFPSYFAFVTSINEATVHDHAALIVMRTDRYADQRGPRRGSSTPSAAPRRFFRTGCLGPAATSKRQTKALRRRALSPPSRRKFACIEDPVCAPSIRRRHGCAIPIARPRNAKPLAAPRRVPPGNRGSLSLSTASAP